MSPWDDEAHGDVGADDGRAPICPECGVTALPRESAHVVDPTFVCENPECEAFGDEV
jgi:hypothetical protein